MTVINCHGAEEGDFYYANKISVRLGVYSPSDQAPLGLT